MADIRIPIEIVDKFSKQFADVNTRVESVGKQLDQLNTRAAASARGFDDIKTAFTAVFGAASIGATISFLKESVRQYSEQENAVKKLDTALKNQGITSQAVSKQIQDYASALQKTTTFGDELILESQQLLVSFGLTGEELNRATKAAMDLSVGMGVDLTSATKLLGKAAQGETDTLGKLGIKIKENASDSEKLGLVLDGVSQRFGGQAAAAAETFAGKLAQLHNQVGELREGIGGALVPDLTVLVDELKRAAEQAPAFVQGLKGIGKEIENSKLLQLAETLQKFGVISLLQKQAELTGAALQQVAAFVRDIGLADSAVTANHTANTETQTGNTERRRQASEQELQARQAALQQMAVLEAQNSDNKILLLQLEQQARFADFQKQIKDADLLAKFKTAQETQLLKFKEKIVKEELKLKQAETKAKLQMEISQAQATIDLASQVFSKNKELAIASIAIAKAIAISNTLASFAKLGPVGKVLGAVQIGLLIAQFAQQASAVGGTNLSKGAVSFPSTEQPELNFPSSGGIGPSNFGGGGGGGGISQIVNVSITEANLGDPAQRKLVINGIILEMQEATAEAIKLAQISAQLAATNSGASA